MTTLDREVMKHQFKQMIKKAASTEQLFDDIETIFYEAVEEDTQQKENLLDAMNGISRPALFQSNVTAWPRRSGFTMIELIFVIVILGILAAVAIPKMVGITEQARLAKAQEFTAQLNSVVMPNLWGKSFVGKNGSVKNYLSSLKNDDERKNLIFYSDIPEGFSISGDLGTQIDLNGAQKPTKTILQDDTNSIYIVCRDSNSTDAPRCWTSNKSIAWANDYNISTSYID